MAQENNKLMGSGSCSKMTSSCNCPIHVASHAGVKNACVGGYNFMVMKIKSLLSRRFETLDANSHGKKTEVSMAISLRIVHKFCCKAITRPLK